MSRKKLPIGIQTFREIREDGCYYVDKTGFALRLIREGKHYFLSRPRRFGKSLFIDTLGELFEGKEALFRGLHCHDKWDWSVAYPVIRISFAEGVLQEQGVLAQRIRSILRVNAERLGVADRPDLPVPDSFIALIQAAERRYGQRVVVLVDEYDKPVLDNLTRPDIARQMRDGLRDLYSVIKGQDAHIKFAMLTGVSKFSKVSLFSGLNNLNDITVDARYSAICGYTDADVDGEFAPELPGLDRQRIREWYNGYNWTGESVYNPFDLLLLFSNRDFRAYWFETGTPTFLIDLLTERRTFLPDLERLQAPESLLSAFEVGDISTEALLFQTGYLTIESVRRIGAFGQYRLRFPNQEVRASLNGALLQRLRPNPAEYGAYSTRLYDLLLANDFAGMEQLFTAFFASIPHDWFRNTPIAQYEGYYASVFYAYFAALGLDIVPEESSNAGRLDMAVRFNGQVYLFEFKVVEIEPEGGALAQIKARGYADKCRDRQEPIHLVGVEFSREQRRVVGFEVETRHP
ncbi:ATP-binding protein [Thauera sp. SDU_THAU2]|uniref:ATP-binding protein n=1 Tax=Thauera sp. SDU_THAU2 TaxID=3136633 RepID=UPI00311FC1C6